MPPDRPARLHAGVAGRRRGGRRRQHGVVAVEQRPVEHRGQLLGGQSPLAAARRRARPLPAAGRPPVIGLAAGRRRSRPSPSSMPVLRPPQREVDLEGGLEGPPVRRRLHQGGAEGVLERLPVLQRDVAHGLGGVEVLGERDRQAGAAQLGDEAGQDVEHVRDSRSAPAVARRPAPWPPARCPSWYFEQDVQRVAWPARRRSSRRRAPPGSAPSRGSRRPRGASSGRGARSERTMRATWSASCLG